MPRKVSACEAIGDGTQHERMSALGESAGRGGKEMNRPAECSDKRLTNPQPRRDPRYVRIRYFASRMMDPTSLAVVAAQ
jgi:hypothetical protein